MAIEDEVRAVLANLDQEEQNGSTQDETGSTTPGANNQEEVKRVIHVDKYTLPDGSALFRLPSGEGVLVPSDTTTENPLDANAVESVPPTTDAEVEEYSVTHTPTVPLTNNGQQEELPQKAEPAPAGTRRQVKLSVILVPLVLLFILTSGTFSYLFLLPLTASATVTITPKTKSLHTDTTFTIAANPKAGQVQGRTLVPISFTKSKTVPATGHGHDDATAATGVVTFYNTDSQPYTIPAGVTFTAPDGATIVTDNGVTVQAAILPIVGSAIVTAHVVNLGSIGNIPAHTIYTRCCGSQFLTATNTTPFTGGQDARSYSFIQTSDIQNAATDILNTLTPQATAALHNESHAGEQLVTPLCSPRTQESAEPGYEAASVTVNVTQTCYSVAYMLTSLQQVATNTLAKMANLANYQEGGTVQVTVSGSTYQQHTATLKVSLAGIWVYRFTKEQLAQLTHQIAGESKQEATATLAKVDGVASVSIHVQRFDFKDQLPTSAQRISVQFFYLVS